MELSMLSRRELQALCKSNGIPANKTNVFMVDALAKKRVPLSKMDSNRDQKTVTAIGSPPFKAPPLFATKNSALDVNSSGPNQQKPPLFQNNFLRRGKRKEAPTLHESDHDEKPKVQSISNGQRPHQMASTKTEAKGKIEDRVQSQIDAALCSKVMKPSAPEEQADILEVKVGNREVLKMPPGRPETESVNSMQPLACQVVEETSTSTLALYAVEQSASLERIAPAPPMSSSPLLRVEEKVRSIVERVQNFWKGLDLGWTHAVPQRDNLEAYVLAPRAVSGTEIKGQPLLLCGARVTVALASDVHFPDYQVHSTRKIAIIANQSTSIGLASEKPSVWQISPIAMPKMPSCCTSGSSSAVDLDMLDWSSLTEFPPLVLDARISFSVYEVPVVQFHGSSARLGWVLDELSVGGKFYSGGGSEIEIKKPEVIEIEGDFLQIKSNTLYIDVLTINGELLQK